MQGMVYILKFMLVSFVLVKFVQAKDLLNENRQYYRKVDQMQWANKHFCQILFLVFIFLSERPLQVTSEYVISPCVLSMYSEVLDVGDVVDRKICFEWNGNSCMWETQVQIRHCNSYYLYYLMDTPICLARYCSVSMNTTMS